jgi:hypothetical protein
MDCVFNTEERLRRRAASGLLLVLAVLVGWLSLADGPARAMSTTTVSAAIFTYDFPAVARVDAHELVAAEASPTQLSEVRKESASPSVQARGASTTSFRSVVATNIGGVPRPAGAAVNANVSQFGLGVDDLSLAAQAADRGGLTAAGYSLTKHGAGARPGNSMFPRALGNPAEINALAQSQVDDILTSPGTTFMPGYRGRFGSTIETTAPDGRGMVFDQNGKFLFFKE